MPLATLFIAEAGDRSIGMNVDSSVDHLDFTEMYVYVLVFSYSS